MGETNVWEAIGPRSWVQLQDFLFPPYPSRDLTSVSTTVSPLLAWFRLRVFPLAHFLSLNLASTVCLLPRSMDGRMVCVPCIHLVKCRVNGVDTQ